MFSFFYKKVVNLFWDTPTNQNNMPEMKKVVVLFPIDLSVDEFIAFRKQDSLFQQKYLSKVYNKIKELAAANTLLAKEHIEDLPRYKEHFECVVTLHCFPEDVKQLENSIQLQKNVSVYFKNIESYIISGKEIINWNYKNFNPEKRLSRADLDELFTYRNPAFYQKDNSNKHNDSKSASPPSKGSY